MSLSTQVTPIASYRGSTSALDHRGWNLALAFQEIFTATVRLRYNRQSATSADSFRTQIKHALRQAEQDARGHGYKSEDIHNASLAVVAFLDESVLNCSNPAFADWPRSPLQVELFGRKDASDVFFQNVHQLLLRADSHETADILEVYYLCLLLGFKGRYAGVGTGELRSIMPLIREKIDRIRGTGAALSPRGSLPADALRVHSTGQIRKLVIVALIMVGIALALFVVFRLR